MKTIVYNFEGKKVKDIELSEAVFNVPLNTELLHEVYVSMDANQRVAIAHTKGRGEVAGSGKKPWKQKGTGRARVGSVRSPIWRGGGIVFGPTKDRNFKKKINKKANAKAILMALSEKLRSEKLIIVDKVEAMNKKTRDIASGLNSLKLRGSILINLSEAEKDTYLYSRNIKNVKCIPVNNLNVLDILNHKSVVLSEESVKYLEKKYN
ncbi:MAG: 50S ribosomal protein L4 [Candidatus Moranbacteria bacterium GW2011_GWE1_35_17]|nr:MAG: 50S ribosomal protein L4 [Candidatus Moranbacteria bacterium GW2011_GWE1_35_17]KKP83796.1 MAG: 50S ribosomal protein L4 [Candidatus Moranbacteria bacterium GW2011_GWF1_35_5]HBR78803.1 50S ribosomal protein L4 [Candidatus Moranbacteria bacterium]